MTYEGARLHTHPHAHNFCYYMRDRRRCEKLPSYFLIIYSRCRLLGTPSVFQSTLELTPTSYKDHCKRLYYLVEKQRELCGLSQNILSVCKWSIFSP